MFNAYFIVIRSPFLKYLEKEMNICGEKAV